MVICRFWTFLLYRWTVYCLSVLDCFLTFFITALCYLPKLHIPVYSFQCRWLQLFLLCQNLLLLYHLSEALFNDSRLLSPDFLRLYSWFKVCTINIALLNKCFLMFSLNGGYRIMFISLRFVIWVFLHVFKMTFEINFTVKVLKFEV